MRSGMNRLLASMLSVLVCLSPVYVAAEEFADEEISSWEELENLSQEVGEEPMGEEVPAAEVDASAHLTEEGGDGFFSSGEEGQDGAEIGAQPQESSQPESETGLQAEAGQSGELMQDTVQIQVPQPAEDGSIEAEPSQELTEHLQTSEMEPTQNGEAGLSYRAEDHTLSISGSGAMEDYCLGFSHETATYHTNAPWEGEKELVETVKVEEGISSVGSYAFYECENLSQVSLSEGIEKVGTGAFQNCNSLKEVDLPDTVSEIGWDVFAGCKSLESVSVSQQMDRIPWQSFMGCVSLSDITIPESVWSIENNAFRGCASLKEIVLPQSLISIGKSAFQLAGLSSIVIPDGVSCLSSGIFGECASLKRVEIPDSVTSIGSGAFENCTKLSSLKIPESVTSIGENAFAGCTKLVLKVKAGSVAEEYAISNGIAYEVLE